jgi:MFS family permease
MTATASRRTRMSADYIRLVAAGSVSQLGTQVSALAVSLIAVVIMRVPAAQAGALVACQSGAYLIAGLPAGLAADKLAPRGILLAGDLARAAAIASVPAAAALHVLTLVQLYVVVCVTGVVTVCTDVARQSLLPSIASGEQMSAANARLATTQSAARVAGPGVAGLLIQLAGAPFAMSADAVSYLLSAVLIRGIRSDFQTAPREHGSLWAQARAGLRFVYGTRTLRDLAFASAWYNFVTAITGVVLMLRLARGLQLPAPVIGEFYSAGAAGGVAGAMVSRRVADLAGSGRALCGALLTGSAGAFLIALTGHGWRIWTGAAGLFVAGAGVAVYNVTQVTMRQRLTPAALLGRTTGNIRLIVTGAVSLGSLTGGELAGAVPPQQVLWLAAIASAAATLIVVGSPVRRECPRPRQAELSVDIGRARITDVGEDVASPQPGLAGLGIAAEHTQGAAEAVQGERLATPVTQGDADR